MQAGRPIFDDVEIVELRYPGSQTSRCLSRQRDFSHWGADPVDWRAGQGEPTPSGSAQQYRQFKAQSAQTKSGTPLTMRRS